MKALLAPLHALLAWAAVSRWLAWRWAAVVGDASATKGQAGAAPGVESMPWRLWQWLAASLRDERRLAWAIVLGLVLLDGVVVGQHVLARHLTYHSNAFDLGNMDQAVWNTLHGHFFRFTNRGIDWYGPPTRLAIHVEPILLLIAPLYLIHSGAETLLVLQTVALALGAVPLFALALRRLPDLPLVCVGFVVAYLAAPELLGEALWDFHPVTLATPLLLAAFYTLDARRYGWFLTAAVLAAACKEDVALALVPLGLLIALRQGRPRLGLGVAAAAVAWTALCFGVIIPHFNAGASVSGNAYWYRYTALGSSPTDALRRVIVHPRVLLTDIFAEDKLGYLALLIRTGGGLGIFAPVWWLAALPELAINLLSAQQPQYSGFYHYNAVLLAVLLVAAVYGTETLRRARVAALINVACAPRAAPPRSLAGTTERLARGWTARIGRLPIAPRLIGPIVVVWLLVATGWNLTVVGSKLDNFWQAGEAPAPYRAEIDTLLQRIPSGATVAATDTLDPHLSDRATIYLVPDPESYRAQYVAADVATVPIPWRGEAIAMLSVMAESGRYRVVGVAGPVVVLEREGPPLEGG